MTKSKAGRKPDVPDQPRCACIHIRCTQAELERIRSNAAGSGETLTEYIVRKCAGV